MGKIIACLDGSAHADSVAGLGAWAAVRTGLEVALLHVAAPHSDRAADGDFSGQIGLGAKSELLEELARVDEERGKLEQQKGQIILSHARSVLAEAGVSKSETLHRRGALVETIAELEADAELIIIGKRGENAASAPTHLGSNLERVIRAVHTPLLVTPRQLHPAMRRFLVAYDGSASSRKAVDYIAANPLLQGLDCHLLMVAEPGGDADGALAEASDKLTAAGFSVQASVRAGKSVDVVVNAYVAEAAIDLLVMGAYGHSKIRSLLLGSTTTAQILNAAVPVLLFR